MKRTRTEYHIKERGIAALAGCLVLASLSFFMVGTQTGNGHTLTIADTTVYRTINATITTTTTSLTYVYSTSIQTSLVTATYIGPDTISLSGSAKSNGVGTTPNQIIFVDTTNNKDVTAALSNGAYQITLPNHAFYIVKIGYTTITAGVGSGECTAGGLAMFFTGEKMTANWTC